MLDGNILLMIDAIAKATILLLAAWLFARISRRSSAAVRHHIWAMAVCGVIVLPVASWLIPGWKRDDLESGRQWKSDRRCGRK